MEQNKNKNLKMLKKQNLNHQTLVGTKGSNPSYSTGMTNSANLAS